MKMNRKIIHAALDFIGIHIYALKLDMQLIDDEELAELLPSFRAYFLDSAALPELLALVHIRDYDVQARLHDA